VNKIELSKVDLNLLVTLSVLLEERSVTTAGRRLGRTPSAMSHALGRLRELIGDPLFVRVGHRLQPTPVAESLSAPLHDTLSAVESLIRQGPFEPARAERSFRLVASDYLQRVLLPELVARLREEAPGVDLRLLPVVPDVAAALADDSADLALGVSFSAPERLKMRALCSDRFVCVSRPESWRCGDDVAAWAALPHALVAPGLAVGSAVDRALAERGLRRRIVITMPHFLAALAVVAASDLVVTLPERLARALAPPGLLIRPPPVPLAPLELVSLWHPRVHADPTHRWLRELVVRAARGAPHQDPVSQGPLG
jgi:DNA-binding transcriptional LysR family regulator